MPAQWPIFINKVSSKLSSLSSASTDEFAIFLANEYFNAIKTSQTIYGNIHQPGQKSILEEGFKKAFKQIYSEEDVQFESKFTNQKYVNMFEKAPLPDTNFDAYCELEKWTEKNKDKLKKFTFYPFFPSTCPTEEKPVVTGEIDSNLLEDSLKPGEPERYVTMTISGFTEGLNYKFLYSINGEDQPLQIATNNVLNVLAPIQPGFYEYTFKGVYDVDGVLLLKEINKTVSLDIKPDGIKVIQEIKDPFIDKKQRSPIPQMTEDERIKNIALRVVYQNDGTAAFSEWLDRLDIGYNKQFGKKVKLKALEILGVGTSSQYDKVRDSIAQKKALESVEKYRKRLIEELKKQTSSLSNELTPDRIKTIFEAEFKRYEKLFKNSLSERDMIEEILKKDKTIKRQDAIEQLFGIPKQNSIINPINEYIFQEEHIDDKTKIPTWLEAADICKFVYIKSIDKRMEGYSDKKTSSIIISKLDPKRFEKAELKRNTEKIVKYLEEKNRWYELLRKWGNSQNGNIEEDTNKGDGYDTMAQSIIDYWKSTAVQPFKPVPPIIPCTSIPPLGGKYVPISYGNKNKLAGDLRKAWNSGKGFNKQSLTPVASKLVASAVSVSFAKHLLEIKFLYLGGLIIPVGPPIPMVGISPSVF